jgi:hypothetical protein
MGGFHGGAIVKPVAVAAVLSTVLAFSTPAFRAADSLPAKISDEAFWKIVAEMSEPDGYFQFENFLSNELGYQYVIPRLLQKTRRDGVYMGVAPEQNFTYIAAIKPKIAFIIDIRRQNTIELLMYKALFEMSETRADFLSKLFARARPAGLNEKSTASELFSSYSKVKIDEAVYKQNLQAIKDLLVKTHRFQLLAADLADRSSLSSLDYVYFTFVQSGPSLDYATGGLGAGLNNPSYKDLMEIDDGAGQTRSYLASEENYRFIRDLEMRNLIIPLVGDFAGPKTIRSVGQYLREHNSIVSAFYLSNVEQYLFDGFKSDVFYQNVSTLPLDASSTFIRAFSGAGGAFGFGGGRGFRFVSVLSSMTELVQEFKAGRVRQYGDVRNLSK